MFPSVQINALNQLSGENKEIERHALFVGVGTVNPGKLLALTPDSDFDKVFGETDTDLKKQVRAAMLNAGQNWFAHVYIAQEDGYDFVECVKKANQTASFEYCVNTRYLGVIKQVLGNCKNAMQNYLLNLVVVLSSSRLYKVLIMINLMVKHGINMCRNLPLCNKPLSPSTFALCLYYSAMRRAY